MTRGTFRTAAMVALLASSASVSATTLEVDFRTWTGADNQSSFTVGNVTATASGGAGTLYQDGTDGLGVRGGETDEVDRLEQLLIDWDGILNVTGVYITDLFPSPDGPLGIGEVGSVTLGLANGGTQQVVFWGGNSTGPNGEQYVGFGNGILATDMTFAAFPRINWDLNNEFSVAGFNATAVPSPTPLALIGIASLALVVVRRRTGH